MGILQASKTVYYGEIQNIADIVRYHNKRDGECLALVGSNSQLSYCQLNLRSNQLANALIRAKVTLRSKVAFLGKESEKYYELLFACAKSRTVIVPINWRLTSSEVSHILLDSETEILFVEPEYIQGAEVLIREMPSLTLVIYLSASGQDAPNAYNYEDWLNSHSQHDPGLSIDPNDSVAQLYTSGTTGLPKGVELAHRSFFAIRDSLYEHGLDWIDWYAGDKSLIGIPGFHVGGLWWAIQGFSAGITNYCLPMFVPGDAVRLIKSHDITTACVVPSMINMMLSEKWVCNNDFKSMRKIVYGGSPISESLLQQAMEIIACDFSQIYGLTETGNTAVCLPPEDHVIGSKRMVAAGKPYPCVKLKIIDKDGHPLKSRQMGEVCIHTPARMKGYWHLKQESEETLTDNWVHTGDVGYIDDGYLYICDRIKDTIIVAGENIYPTEVENALCKHPSVSEASVIGVPDQKWGESVLAFVVTREGQEVTQRELLVFLKKYLANFKLPAYFEFIDKVPRNPSGKILRRKLREKYWRHMDRKVN